MSTNWRRFAGIFTLIVSLLLCASPVAAQQATGKIVGTIADPQGAVLPGVNVTVTNLATDAKTVTQTDKDGYFQALNLPIGTYKITAVHTGFRELVTTTAPLQINQAMRYDLRMQIGAREEVVEVGSTAAAVETVNATIGQSITARPIVDMPLNGRNVLDLALLQPGVTETNPGSTSGAQAGTFGIAGGKSDSVTFLLDGGPNNDLLANGVVYNPSPDTVAEFRILSSNYTAEYGRNAGGIISVVTKSGTNTLHGSASDFLRNDAFNANSYFNNLNGVPKEVLKRNQFGGQLGGPAIKDKLFFFASYTGQRQTRVQTTNQLPVFTPTELTGDFSKSGPGGTPDPQVAAFLATNPYWQANPGLAAQAIIDPTKINPTAKKYIAAGLVPTSPTGGKIAQASSTDINDQVTAKVDYVIGAKDKLMATLGWGRAPVLNPFSFTFGSTASDAYGYGSTGDHHRRFANIAWGNTFSPTNRYLLIRKYSGLFKNLVITPRNHMVFKADLERARHRLLSPSVPAATTGRPGSETPPMAVPHSAAR